MDTKPIAEARANLTELGNQVRLQRRTFVLTRRGTPQAALVPFELGEAAEAVGGADKAAAILSAAGKKKPVTGSGRSGRA